jgi:predicted DCC family thiol-disulfide oxidoreductase YuxK
MRSDAPYSLLYDGDCRVCSAFARAVRLVDVRRALHIERIQQAQDLLQSIPSDARLASAHAVAPDGRVTSGGDAMPAILAALVAGPAFERKIRSSRTSMALLARVYAVMAGVRGRLSCASGAAVAAGRSPR